MIEYFDKNAKGWDRKQYRIDRARVIAEEIKNTFALSKESVVLDFGCGTGLLGLELADSVGRIWLGDNSDGMLSEAASKIACGNIENAELVNLEKKKDLPLFDLIISSMVLHHIEDVGRQIKEIVGWIRVDGYICLCDLDKEDGSFHQEETVPHNGFDRAFIINILKENNISEIADKTVFINRKEIDGVEKEFPLFMITGRKFVGKPLPVNSIPGV